MKATDFRIGNLVYVKECDSSISIDEIVSIHNFKKIDKIKTKRGWVAYSPILLNEDQLLKYGFIKSTDFLFIKEEIKLHWYSTDSCYMVYIGDNTISSICAKYVHQLQNLIYALTGEELPLKEQL